MKFVAVLDAAGLCQAAVVVRDGAVTAAPGHLMLDDDTEEDGYTRDRKHEHAEGAANAKEGHVSHRHQTVMAPPPNKK